MNHRNPLRTRACRMSGLLLLACMGSVLAAPPCTIANGPARPVVELFTSEGCSSCPPADAWLASLRQDDTIAGAPILLAWHVDYWDDLGWPDPFAQHAFSERQQAYASVTPSRGVYTPQVLWSGREWRNWGGAGGPPAASGSSPTTDGQRSLPLTAVVHGQQLEVTLPESGQGADGATRLLVMVTEDALQSQPAAGENRDRRLRHDGVVRTWWRQPWSAHRADAVIRLTLPAGQKLANSRVVAMLQENEAGRLLRATSLPLNLPGCVRP